MNGLNLLQQYIKEQELTGVILMSPINLHYFAGFTGTTGFAIITQDKAFMITDSDILSKLQNNVKGIRLFNMKQLLWILL